MSRLQKAFLSIAPFAVLLALGCGGYGRPAEPPPPAAPAEQAAAASTAATDCDAQPRNHVIEVGASAVSCKEPHVSKKAGNQITWRSTTGDNIEVVFKPKAGVVPFPSLSCPGSSPICNSGAIDPAADGKYDYDVWQITASGKVAIDPAVIIDP